MNNVNYYDDKEFLESFNKHRTLRANTVYRHFKGGWYIVEDIAQDCDSSTKLVIYRNLKTRQLWVRKLDNFIGIKQTEKGFVLRFTQCEF